ncbi:hypothetical protein V6N13_074404 [Hibiscus sabdariffa]
MAFLLELKLEVVSQFLVSSIWPHDTFEFVYAPSVGASEGILVIWDGSRFRSEHTEVLSWFVVLKGVWSQENFNCGLMAVYAPCGAAEQLVLWESMG